MWRTAVWLLPLMALCLWHNCVDGIDTITSKEIADSSSIFTLELLQKALGGLHGNKVLSPVSISTLLAMLQQGAVNNSLDQITTVLHSDPTRAKEGYGHIIRSLKKRKSSSLILEFGNRAFVQNELDVNPEYKQALIHDFMADIEPLDFKKEKEAASQINAWIANVTHNHVPALISPDALSERTQLVLANAMFFKGVWLTPFLEENTIERDFSPEPDMHVRVPMMHHNAKFRAGDDPALGAKWVELPFDGEEFSMVLVLPNKRHGLDDLVALMKPQHLSNMLNTRGTKLVYLALPKFKLSTQVSLVPTLQELGLTDIFNTNSQLGGIVSSKALSVSDIIHKVEIEVNEKGGSASAATSILVATLSLVINPDELEFNADHPFLAIIVDRVNSVPLFAGRVFDPSQT